MYLLLKAVQWFTICGTYPPSGLAIVRSETKVVASHSTNKNPLRWRRSVNCEPQHGRYTLYHSFSCPKFQFPIKSPDVTIFEKQC